MQLANAPAGAPPQQMPYKMSRASDGKMRIDYGGTSVITDPATGKMIVLDHAAKEVRTLPLPKPPDMPKPPELPKLPGAPAAPQATPLPLPGMTVKELGKKLVEGHEVEGHEYTLPPLKPPGMPQPPKKPEPAAVVSEVWLSASLHVPVLTRMSGPFGKQTCHCKNLTAGEPHPSLFEIPKDYKPPKLPA
jgi:hypothetical protein